MPFPPFFFFLSFIVAGVLAQGETLSGFPDRIYGVNLGSWMIALPWMMPDKWVQMGGESCTTACWTCISSEFDFAKAYPDTVDATFKTHWETWFSQDDVNELVDAGINAVRIPLGYWIVEPLVDRTTEFYPKGGLVELKRGVAQLKEAGIKIVLDHHAVPEVAYPNRMDTGRCTDEVGFYTPENYHRALIWIAVISTLSHCDPDFSTVAAIQAINLPIEDAALTPGLGEYYENFVQTMRAVEYSLGILNPDAGRGTFANVTEAIAATARSSDFTPEIRQALTEAIPMIAYVASQLNVNLVFEHHDLGSYLSTRGQMVANFMDVNSQHNEPYNPADAADGPQAYDSHIYYAWGGPEATEEAYMTSMCNLGAIEASVALRNSPLWVGGWSLATQFNATEAFLPQWADAQKLAYSKSAGWFFWGWKLEESEAAEVNARQWSYSQGLERGYLTKDPSKLINPDVCAPYINTAST